MKTVTAYRAGGMYLLEPAGRDAEPVKMALDDGAEVRSSPGRKMLVYHRTGNYGVPLMVAMALGWCQPVE